MIPNNIIKFEIENLESSDNKNKYNNNNKIELIYENDNLNLYKELTDEKIIVYNDSQDKIQIKIKSIGIGDEEYVTIDSQSYNMWTRENGLYLTEIRLVNNNNNSCYRSCFYLEVEQIYVLTKDLLLIDYTNSEIQEPTQDKFSFQTLGYIDKSTFISIKNIDIERYCYTKNFLKSKTFEEFSKTHKLQIEKNNLNNFLQHKSSEPLKKGMFLEKNFDINNLSYNPENLFQDIKFDKEENNKKLFIDNNRLERSILKIDLKTIITNEFQQSICIRMQDGNNSKTTDGFKIVAFGEKVEFLREVGYYILEINTIYMQKFYYKIEAGMDYSYFNEGIFLETLTQNWLENIPSDAIYLLDKETDLIQINCIKNFFSKNNKIFQKLLKERQFCSLCLIEINNQFEDLESHWKNKHTINFGQSIICKNIDSDENYKFDNLENNDFRLIDDMLKDMNIPNSKMINEECRKNIFDYTRDYTNDFSEKSDEFNNDLLDKYIDRNEKIDILNEKLNFNENGIKEHNVSSVCKIPNLSFRLLGDNISNIKLDEDIEKSKDFDQNSNFQKDIELESQQSFIKKENLGYENEKYELIEKILLRIGEKIELIEKKIEEDWEKRQNEKQEQENLIQNLNNKFEEKNYIIQKKNEDFNNLFKKNNNLLIELKADHKLIKENLKKQNKKLGECKNFIFKKQKNLINEYQNLNRNFNDNFHKVEKELLKVNLEIAENKNEKIDFSVPELWKDFDNSSDFSLFPLSKDCQEFLDLQLRFLSTVPNAKILKITRIKNLLLWKNYCFAKHSLKLKGNAEEKLLFHGTRKTDPKLIYEGKEEGFDMRFCFQGLWGIGCYFHQNAIYSATNYCYKNPESNNFIILLANVLVGNSIMLPQDRTLRLPPFLKDNNNVRYDSVNSGDGIYIIYNNQRAYPAYVIEYNY